MRDPAQKIGVDWSPNQQGAPMELQPGARVQVGEVGSPFIPSSVPRDRAISGSAGLGL